MTILNPRQRSEVVERLTLIVRNGSFREAAEAARALAELEKADAMRNANRQS